MKKLLMLFSSVLSLFFVTSVSANQNIQPYSDQYPCTSPCVGRCDNTYVDQGACSCWDGNFYVGGFGGANWLNFDRTHGIKPKMKVGGAGALSLGYKFNNGLRLEGEVAYRRNSIHGKDWLKKAHYADAKLSGSSYSWAYMANILYDFDCFSECLTNVVPYVGVGVGYANVHTHVKARNGYEGDSISIKGEKKGVAGQAIAGVGYRLTDSTTLGVEYRYFVAREHVRDHSVGLSLRQAF